MNNAGRRLVQEGKVFCIDYHEYPGRGRLPRTQINWEGAKALCERANKRLCSSREWRRGCVGRGGSDFPYGRRFNATRCNTEDPDGEERQLARTGSFNRCKSAAGLYDMSGNVSEWTLDKRALGGNYASFDDEAQCTSGGRRSPGSQSRSLGFRCCSDLR